jgi:hypothetical protein
MKNKNSTIIKIILRSIRMPYYFAAIKKDLTSCNTKEREREKNYNYSPTEIKS